MIELDRAGRSFKVKRALVHAVRDLSFRVEPGEFVGYLGPNGAGKSTTIKMLCGILTPHLGAGACGGARPLEEAHDAGQEDRRGVRAAHDAVVGSAAQGQLRTDPAPLQSRSQGVP
ncbi:hypothetical protein GCM10020219_071080 [Nonomuraea dietziae]